MLGHEYIKGIYEHIKGLYRRICESHLLTLLELIQPQVGLSEEKIRRNRLDRAVPKRVLEELQRLNSAGYRQLKPPVHEVFGGLLLTEINEGSFTTVHSVIALRAILLTSYDRCRV